MNNAARLLHEDDVISTGSSAVMFQCTFKVSEFLAILQSRLEEHKLFGDGLDCELLTPGQEWKKGKMKLKIEFEPDDAVPGITDEAVGYHGGNYAASVEQLPPADTQVVPPLEKAQSQSVGMWS